MVDDHDLRFFGVTSHSGDEAGLVVIAAGPDARLARGRDETPCGCVFRKVVELRAIASLRLAPATR